MIAKQSLKDGENGVNADRFIVPERRIGQMAGAPGFSHQKIQALVPVDDAAVKADGSDRQSEAE